MLVVVLTSIGVRQRRSERELRAPGECHWLGDLSSSPVGLNRANLVLGEGKRPNESHIEVTSEYLSTRTVSWS